VLCEVLEMRRIKPSSEAEMIALFLRTELSAARFQHVLQELPGRASLPEQIVTDPHLDSPAEHQARRQLLTWHRDYGARTGLFNGFPDDVRWEWMGATPVELARVRYIDNDYWVELSGGTRLAIDAAPRIRAGVAPSGWTAPGPWAWRERSPRAPGFHHSFWSPRDHDRSASSSYWRGTRDSPPTCCARNGCRLS